MSDAYAATIEKLDSISKILQECINDNDMNRAEEYLALLRDYGNCYYCQDHRKSLTEDKPGVCAGCPCGKLGEKLLGRTRAYNSCYLVREYRDMVRDSLWFITDKSPVTIEICVKSIQKLKIFMEQHKVELGG